MDYEQNVSMPCGVENCEECYDAHSCDFCYEGFHVVTNETTTDNGEFFVDYFCEQNTEPPTCLENEYVGEDNLCYPCEFGCQQCFDYDGVCEFCEQGFELMTETMADGSTYVFCQETTTTCDVGLFYDIDFNECRPCADGCMDCSAHHLCHECVTGLELQWTTDQTEAWCVEPSTCLETEYLGGDGNCYPCDMDGCLKCYDGDGQCEICADGFDIITGTETDGEFTWDYSYCQPLQGCDWGLYMDETGVCQPCSYGCMDCVDAFTCNECEFGF